MKTVVALLLAATVALLSAGFSYGGSALTQTPQTSSTANPSAAATAATITRKRPLRLTQPLYVDPKSEADTAASTDARFDVLASTPQARWFTDGTAPLTQATAVARDYAQAARLARQTPVAVLYAIPGRDCGLHSSGGLPEQTYRQWVNEIAEGLRGSRALVILEPDAVAMLGDCAGQGDRAAMLTYAAQRLTANGSWVYLDAGHSQWHSAAVIAQRLDLSGIRHARGFVTNVSNYRTTAVERTYGKQIVAALAARGVHNRRFIIDVSRNGAGPDHNGEWCNPSHARVGAIPRIVASGGPLDALLWVKRPGESDGYCNGGPSAGSWWTEGALRLIGQTP